MGLSLQLFAMLLLVYVTAATDCFQYSVTDKVAVSSLSNGYQLT
jgi:hypothetical protein